MPTAIEYAVAEHWHAQNGCGSGPPAQNLVLVHSGTSTAGTSLAGSPANPADGWLVGGLPAVLLLAVAIVAGRRRWARSRPDAPVR